MGNEEAVIDVLGQSMVGGTRVRDHVMSINAIYIVLKAIGVDFSIQYAQLLLVYTLPTEWEDYGVNLVGRDPPFTFEEIAENLEQKELDREIHLLQLNCSKGQVVSLTSPSSPPSENGCCRGQFQLREL
ncbi:hypothetical protein AMTR_s00053p00228190 [Amborella trichopoda]|uniref:Uncharacterized protein n=1 Tax=Amborella trichopoda TaxID=13333 RepID=W1PC68_AMBTC|nr:hypothetical protein AMTR_s00053p00228190 [Amborella trichopoda]